jgi:hypothetical protein
MARASGLKGLLADQGLTVQELADFRALPPGKGGLFLVVWALEAGFTAPGLAVISEQDVLGDRLVGETPPRKRKAENFLREVDRCRPAIWWCMSNMASAAIWGSRRSPRLARPMPASRWNMPTTQSFTCRSRTSNCSAAMAMKRGCWTVWAAAPGRPRRRG